MLLTLRNVVHNVNILLKCIFEQLLFQDSREIHMSIPAYTLPVVHIEIAHCYLCLHTLFHKFFWMKRLGWIVLHALPTLNANCNSTALAGWWRLEWRQSEGATLMMEWVETETKGRNSRWLVFFFSPPDIWWTLLKCDTFHLSKNLRLSDSQLPRIHHGLPQLVNVLAESNLAQT